MAEVKSIQEQMAELERLALELESDLNLRWEPSEHDLKVMHDNAVFMMPYQYATIKGEMTDDRI